jgi:spore maturation protein SpmB
MSITVSYYQSKLKTGAISGARKGLKSFFWMCEIIIPVSLLVMFLQWTGWLGQFDLVLKPLMNVLNLPAEAALPIIMGMIVNLYAVIAILSIVPFTIEQMTLIAIFSLIAHNLIMEGIIQFRSGINVIKATIIRVAVAIFTVFIVSRFLGGSSFDIVMPPNMIAHGPLLVVLKAWAIDTVMLLLKVLGLIMGIMLAMEISKSMGWIDRLFTVFKPVMRTFGLSNRASVAFIAGIFFGLLYGGAVIVEEGKRGTVSRAEMEHLHVALGINHAMIEDTALFAMLGINILWLLLPKVIMAIIAVHVYKFSVLLMNKLRRRTVHTVVS